MQDIDFDELDKAVNSVLTQPDTTEAPAVSQTVPERSSLVSARSTPLTSPAARRSSGRFMDVFHPSSDMRPDQKPTTTAPVSPDPEPTVEVAPEPADTKEFAWPDPLDLSDDTTEPAAEVQPEPTIKEEPAAVTPLDSPFLTDAQVEKRPLGAFSDTTPALDLSDALKEEELGVVPVEVEDEVAVEPVAPVEAEVSQTSPVQAEDVTDLEVSEEALIGSTETADTSSSAQPEEAPEVPAQSFDIPASTTLATASIPQQYKEHPADDNQPSGAIYDTEAYHQPLAHPQKKSSGWLVVLWVLGLILLGGGIGALLYFFVLPQL